MNLKQINFIVLVLLLFFCATQTNHTLARTTNQYQLYRLSDDPSDDRRPKLAINDQGTVWVVWESDRDGDFDLYGKRSENEVWSGLIEVVQDSNATFISDVFFHEKNRLLVFGTEADSIYWLTIFGFLFYKEFIDNSFSEKKYVTYVQHINPYYGKSEWIPNQSPQISSLCDNLVICYHRDYRPLLATTFNDSLFLKYLLDETWSNEICDSVFFQVSYGIENDRHFFPVQRVNLASYDLFLIKKSYYHGNFPYYHEFRDIGLLINQQLEKKYVLLHQVGSPYSISDPVHYYGSDKNSIFRSILTYIQQLDLSIDGEILIKRQWKIKISSNIKISQMSDLVVFVWSDSANIYVKTYQDSIWYETLDIPLNGLTHIEHSLNCAVYNNQQIWVAFDTIYNGNKDVYALSVPACFVVDTVLTSVKQITQNNTFLNDFALFQNYPNPFNSSTEIKYSLPQEKSSYHVNLKIYDIRGKLVNTLVNQNQVAGAHSVSWDGKDMNRQLVSSGMYFYTLQADKFKATNKMLLIH